jgi:hypothetical protein
MAGGDIGRTQSERSAGTTAACELWQNWPDYEDVHDPLSPTFAEAALSGSLSGSSTTSPSTNDGVSAL